MTYYTNESAFHDAFIRMGRKDQFSYAGRSALFEYLEGLAESMEEPLELDVIAICCDWYEYADIAEYNEAYGTEFESWDDVEQNAIVIPHSHGSAIVSAH